MTVTGWGWLLVSCSRWWCRFDDDDNVREMIVRAMTSESGEMCNLEERGPDTRLSQRMSSNETQNSVSTKADWEDLLHHEWVHRCSTEVHERQSKEVADDSKWPIHKTQGCRYSWVVEEPSPSCDVCGNVWPWRLYSSDATAAEAPWVSRSETASCKMHAFAGYISGCVAGAFMACLRGRGRRTFFCGSNEFLETLPC